MTNLLISSNVDPSSKTCEGCLNNSENEYCTIFDSYIFNMTTETTERLKKCLSAQKQAEESLSLSEIENVLNRFNLGIAIDEIKESLRKAVEK
jgi:hypothetical protein